MHRTSHLFSLSLALLVSLMSFAGCGAGDAASTDDTAIQSLVADVSDASFDAAKFADMFVVNTAPPDDERQRYPIYMYRTKSIASPGDSATAMIEIEHGTSGEILGEFEWKLQRSDGSWKLTAAPLPAQ